MKASSSSLLAVLGFAQLGVLGCAGTSIQPRYASIEPVTEQIPAVTPEIAQKRLDRSRLYWTLAVRRESKDTEVAPAIWRETDKLASPQHSYIRAIQVGADSVRLTYVSVEGGRPIARGLGIIEPSRWFGAKDTERTVRPLWKENRIELGTHDDGAEALSIDALYDQCAREISRPGAGPIHLYFHPSGVLMHCGRTSAECPTCATVSIHAYATNSISPWASELDVSKWACVEAWGVVPLGAPDWLRGRHEACGPPVLPSRIQKLPRDESLAGICEIDPAACPIAVTAPTIAGGPWHSPEDLPYWPVRHPLQYLEVGKSDPDEALVVTSEGRIRPLRSGSGSIGIWPELLERNSITSLPEQDRAH